MKIGILDDESIWRDKIHSVITKYFEINDGFDFEIICYEDYKTLLRSVDIDLLFLDIELSDGKSGFEVAKQLNEAGKDCRICILTSHTEFARLGYRINSFRYIDKSYLEEINEALDAFLATQIQERKVDIVLETGKIANVKLKDIELIETFGRKLRYECGKNITYIATGRISEVQLELEKYGFCHVQRSYIVNLRYIKQYDSRMIELVNGKQITLSRNHIKNFRKQYFNWRKVLGS